jgi:tRNA dimethylallyltransferase
MEKKLIVITGPTGVGKTDFVDNLVARLGVDRAEVINIDMGQFYEPLSIGTAKPDYRASSYKQHLFDIVKEPANFTVTEYRKLVLDRVEELYSKNILPILVGGSAFYIRSLLFPPIDGENSKIQKVFNDKSTDELWLELKKIDSKRASEINKNDRYRLERALTIWHESGKKPSEFIPEINLFADKMYIFILTRDRNELYERINYRVIQMMNAGWINEVKNLNKKWIAFLKKKKLIGYDDIINFLENRLSQNVLIENIQQKTRNYAKRQLTFYRKLAREIEAIKGIQKYSNSISLEWINLSEENSSLYIDQLLDKIF